MVLFNTVGHNSLTSEISPPPPNLQDFHSWHLAVVREKRRASEIRFPYAAGEAGESGNRIVLLGEAQFNSFAAESVWWSD